MSAQEEGKPQPRRLQEREDLPELLVKLQERKERHKERGRLYRAGNVIVGAILVLVGIVLSSPGVPGPGFVVILLGLGLLALEFDRAERLLERVVIWADQLKDRAEAASTREKVLAGVLALVVVGAFIGAALMWDIPLLPV